MFQHVIFDLDGTLVDSLLDLAAAGNHALAEQGLPTHSPDAYRRMIGNGIPKLIERMLGPLGSDELVAERTSHLFHEYYAIHVVDKSEPYPYIVDMINQLNSKNVNLAILSNKSQFFVDLIVRRFFDGKIDCVVGWQEGQLPKPDPALVLGILKHWGIANPKDVLLCGDSDVDIATAKNAGLQSCGVLWGFRDRAALEAARADYIVADVASLQKLILNG